MNIMTMALIDNRLCKLTTGIGLDEFNMLLKQFTPMLNQALKDRNPGRKRVFGGGRKGHLSQPSELLFVVLMYLKIHPTYKVGGLLLGGIDPSNLCRWLLFLFPVLLKTLGTDNLKLSKHQVRSVEEFLELYPGNWS